MKKVLLKLSKEKRNYWSSICSFRLNGRLVWETLVAKSSCVALDFSGKEINEPPNANKEGGERNKRKYLQKWQYKLNRHSSPQTQLFNQLSFFFKSSKLRKMNEHSKP